MNTKNMIKLFMNMHALNTLSKGTWNTFF